MTWALVTYPVHGFTAIRRSPQSLLPAVSALLMPPPPQPARPRPRTAAMATSRIRRSPRPILLFLPSAPRSVRGEVEGSAAIACRRIARDPVQHHAERGDRDARREALAEQLVLREAGDHDVAEAPAADEAADHDHREHVEKALVGGQ